MGGSDNTSTGSKHIGSSSRPAAAPPGSPPTLVIKKLSPHAPGARRWAATYGEQRVCVRYRVDPQRQRRLTTVEIVVDKALTMNSVQMGLRVAWAEKELGRALRAAGGTWDANTRLWMVSLRQAKAMGLVGRLVLGRRGEHEI